jgi:hypothetical protein
LVWVDASFGPTGADGIGGRPETAAGNPGCARG